MGTAARPRGRAATASCFRRWIRVGCVSRHARGIRVLRGRDKARPTPRLVASFIRTSGSPRRRRELDRCGRVLRVAIRGRRPSGPAADRSRVGIRRARASAGALPVGRRHAGVDSERRTRSAAGAVAGDTRRADRLRPSRHRNERARMVRRLARQGLLRPIAGAESRRPRPGVRRAARGGAWRHAHTICRATLRSKLDPSFRYNDFGFRLARNP